MRCSTNVSPLTGRGRVPPGINGGFSAIPAHGAGIKCEQSGEKKNEKLPRIRGVNGRMFFPRAATVRGRERSRGGARAERARCCGCRAVALYRAHSLYGEYIPYRQTVAPRLGASLCATHVPARRRRRASADRRARLTAAGRLRGRAQILWRGTHRRPPLH